MTTDDISDQEEKALLREMANNESLEMRAAYEVLFERKYGEEP